MKSKKIIIDLRGPQGNAFYILGVAQSLCRETKIADFNLVQKEMTNGDYQNLIKVFKKYFKNYVTIKN